MSDFNIIDNDAEVQVENMTDIPIGYVLPSSGVIRRFVPSVAVAVKVRELRELSYQNGGEDMLRNYLRVKNRDLAREFGVSDDSFDNEYNWTEKDIDNALNSADIDILLDALDFAPEGIVTYLKNRAIKLEIPDTRKLEAIGRKTGCDMQEIIRNKHAYDNVDGSFEEKPKARRAAKKTTTNTRRRVTKKTVEE